MPREPAATSARHARPPFRRAATSTTPTGIMPIGPVWLNTAKRSDLVGAMNRAAISGSWLREKCAFRRRRTAASAGRLAPADAQFDRRGSVTWRRTMKMLTAAASNGGRGANQSGQNYNGYYRGYPLEEWYRTDGW